MASECGARHAEREPPVILSEAVRRLSRRIPTGKAKACREGILSMWLAMSSLEMRNLRCHYLL
jgi:hypothetical protein